MALFANPISDFFWKGVSPENQALSKKVGSGIIVGGISFSGMGKAIPKTSFWQSTFRKEGSSFTTDTSNFLKKIPLPSLMTTAKVAGTGIILYGGYKASESIGRFTETGSFTKKELKIGAIDTPPGSPPGLPAGAVIAGERSPIYNILPEQTYPGTGSFVGDIGAGLGRGAGETGEGIGGGLSMAIPVLAVGGLAYILLKEKKGHKK